MQLVGAAGNGGLRRIFEKYRNTNALIVDYFDSFLLKKPQGVILSGNITTGCNWAQDAGIYEFTMGADGSKVKARYTYVYVWEAGQWRIS